MNFTRLEEILRSIIYFAGKKLNYPETDNDDLTYWRERIVLAIYLVFALIGFLACIPSLYFAVIEEKWWITIVDIISYAAVLYFLFSGRHSFNIRALFLLLIVYGIGITLMFTVSPEYALIWLFVFAVLSTVLFGFAAACMALIVNFITLVVSGFFIHQGTLLWGPYGKDSTAGWMIISINFILVTGMSTIAVATLVERLKRTIEEEKKGRERLLEEHLRFLEETKQRKEAENEQKILQEKLQQDQKMKAIGVMAGGVAHDLNNILSGIVGYPDLLLMQLPEDSELRSSVEAIRDSGIRAAGVVDNLLTISRDAATVKDVQNLNDLVREFIDSPEFQRIKAGHEKVRFVVNLHPNLRNIICSPVHIKKCLMNLVLNGFEAIDGPGSVTLSSYNEYVSKPLPTHHNVDKGDYSVISVTDTGSGIDDEDLSHIFEPFYSKKLMGQSGSGLGLAIVWNSILEHQGGIFIDSSPSGTTFQLYFPSTFFDLSSKEDDGDIKEYYGNQETILIVDDEYQQRAIATELLESLNYKVVSVPSGEKALEFLKRNAADLVVLDMIMNPGINGRQTYEKMIQHNPVQKAIIVSGYSVSEEVLRVQKLGAAIFIKKPYTLAQLGKAVCEGLLQVPMLP